MQYEELLEIHEKFDLYAKDNRIIRTPYRKQKTSMQIENKFRE